MNEVNSRAKKDDFIISVSETTPDAPDEALKHVNVYEYDGDDPGSFRDQVPSPYRTSHGRYASGSGNIDTQHFLNDSDSGESRSQHDSRTAVYVSTSTSSTASSKEISSVSSLENDLSNAELSDSRSLSPHIDHDVELLPATQMLHEEAALKPQITSVDFVDETTQQSSVEHRKMTTFSASYESTV